MTRSRASPETSIFELVELTYKFIRYELFHAGVGVAVFGIIFLILKPWDNTNNMDSHPFLFVGPPLVYFTLDLFIAMFLHLSLRNELKPSCCLIWVAFQIANLVLLTLLGFYMVWNYYYRGNTYLRLTLALIVLYGYKSFRISQMHKLIILMRNRCTMTTNFGNMTYPTTITNEKHPYIISTHVTTIPVTTNNQKC